MNKKLIIKNSSNNSEYEMNELSIINIINIIILGLPNSEFLMWPRNVWNLWAGRLCTARQLHL